MPSRTSSGGGCPPSSTSADPGSTVGSAIATTVQRLIAPRRRSWWLSSSSAAAGCPVRRPAVRNVTRDTALSAAAGAPFPTTSPITTIDPDGVSMTS